MFLIISEIYLFLFRTHVKLHFKKETLINLAAKKFTKEQTVSEQKPTLAVV